MDKSPSSHYKGGMRIPYLYSAAAATFAIFVTVDVVIQHLAMAAPEGGVAATLPKPEPSHPPIVFARFAKADASVGLQPLDDTLHCQGDAFFSDVDVCGPVPQLTSTKGISGLTPPKWLLPKMPVNFIWQQTVNPGTRLVVELSDTNGRPVNAATKSYQKNEKISIEIAPHNGISGTELHLVGNIYAADNKRLENWTLPVFFK